MQIIENSLFGLRAARIRLRHSSERVSITIFPMVHIGEASFYEQVFAEAEDHDVVLFEGVRARPTRFITASYRWLNLQKLGLVKQPRLSFPDGERPKLVHADLNLQEFEIEWRNMPIWLRLLIYIGAPAFGLFGRFTATRESVCKRAGLDLLRDPDDILEEGDEFEPLRHTIRHSRDAKLISTLQSEIDASIEGTSIAIIYGANHIPPVVRWLTKRGFATRPSEWMTIMNAD